MQKDDSCVTYFYFLMTNEASYPRWNSTSSIKNYIFFQHFCTHVYTHIYVAHKCLYFVPRKIQVQWTTATGQMVFPADKESIGKWCQLLSYLKEIHEGFCIPSMFTKPRSDTRLWCYWFLGTPGVQNYRSDHNKKLSQAAATGHYKPELIIPLFPPLHPQQELEIWLTTDLDGGGLIQINWKWFQ